MSYTVLARKYRPQDFDALVGQLPVSQTLLNAIESGRIAHAYVFAGPRGVGKTTTARILAKCLNCEKGTTMNPCNTCASCQEIAQGTSMQDVLEIDGASNRGIDQIRDLRESAKYAPAKSRYRIFIIDEAHQITKDAFGALLKTLEEPPPHVIFMMATTDVQKIPAPILSRCQRFTLRPISPDLTLEHLKKICTVEKIKTDDAALSDIVRFTEGSLRDALSLLDQALVFAPNGITSQTLRDLLGLLPEEVVRHFAGVIDGGDPVAVLKGINTIVRDGIDVTQMGKDLQTYYHTLLLAKAGVEDPLLINRQALTKVSAAYDFRTLERNIRLLSRALDEMRSSDSPRAVFEISVLQLAQKTLDPRELVERLEKLERNDTVIPANAGIQALNNPLKKVEKLDTGVRRYDEPVSPSALQSAPQPVSQPTSRASFGPEQRDAIQSAWGDFLNDVAKEKQGLAAALENAVLSFSTTGLSLGFTTTFNQQLVMKNIDALKNMGASRFGVNLSIETKLIPSDGKPLPPPGVPQHSMSLHHVEDPQPEMKTTYEDVAPADAGDAAQQALKHFPGTLKREKKPA